MLKKLLQYYHNWRYQRRVSQQQFNQKTVSEIFTETYHKRYWKSKESVSGMGSELAETAALRTALPALLHDFGIQSLLDLPCGDFNWMQQVDLQGIQYIGADLVESLVAQNQQQYAHEGRSFLCLDLLTDDLPAVDCILVRDCLVHFSLAHIEQALANIKRSKIKYLLSTSFASIDVNEAIQTGYWRPVNLQKAPFCFPEPLASLPDSGPKTTKTFPDKRLCLWEVGRMHLGIQEISSPKPS